jgi:uncharacterized protein
MRRSSPRSSVRISSHFAGDYALGNGATLFRGVPSEVGSGTVSDPTNRTQIKVDVAVPATQESSNARRILSLGEAKWGEVIGSHHLERLARARELLKLKGYNTDEAVLVCYGSAGFTPELIATAAKDHRVLLVDLKQLYEPPLA